ncbi:hypothetical protein [Zhongshania aliphaticivorans]|uniref:hypothetical protein n=1 Tax=Zhongshania aliphaticivorans TaxID=1470434 RepID=UPI0039C90BE9
MVEFANRVAEEIPKSGVLSFELLPESSGQYTQEDQAATEGSMLDMIWPDPAPLAHPSEYDFPVGSDGEAISEFYSFLGCIGEFRQKLIEFFEADIDTNDRDFAPKMCSDLLPKP